MSYSKTQSLRIILLLALIAQQCLLTLSAKCTFYGSAGAGESGEKTANGENFNPIALTCTALPHIPMGKVLVVTNQRNGRSITVRVNDRFGAPPAEDALDLTYGAFGLLDSHDRGEIPCSYAIL